MVLQRTIAAAEAIALLLVNDDAHHSLEVEVATYG
jgi:hypothetical protein